MASRFLVFSAVGAAALAAAVSVLVYQGALFDFSGGSEAVEPEPGSILAEGGVAAAPAPVQTAAVGPAAATSAPARTETMVFDSWKVACQRSAGDSARRICSAILSLHRVEQNKRQFLGAWIIGRNKEGVLMTALQAPMFQTRTSSAGIHIRKGVEFKLGTGTTRTLPYAACEPQRCEALMPMDQAMVREALNAADATITIYNRDGAALNINVPSIKGIDKALAAMGS
jgi:invasion protein IalB